MYVHNKPGYINSYFTEELEKINRKTKFKQINVPSIYPGSDRLVQNIIHSRHQSKRSQNAGQTQVMMSSNFSQNQGDLSSMSNF